MPARWANTRSRRPAGACVGPSATETTCGIRCYRELMANTEARLTQEIARFGGDCAHVHHESIDTRHDDAAGEAWLHGCFSYLLYRREAAAVRSAGGLSSR